MRFKVHFSILVISSTRVWCRPPSNCVVRKALTICASCDSSFSAPRQRMLASLCCRERMAMNSLTASPALIPLTLLAAMHHPDAGAANQNAAVVFAGGHRFAHRLGDIRVIHSGFGICSEILILISPRPSPV